MRNKVNHGLSTRCVKLLCALVTIGVYGAANVPPGKLLIIANPNVAAADISRGDLNRVFLMITTSLPGGGHVEPVLQTSGVTSDLFMKEYIGRTTVALFTYYRGLMFAGKASMPRSFDSDLEVAEYVARTKGAIGYVGPNVKTAGVKIMRIK